MKIAYKSISVIEETLSDYFKQDFCKNVSSNIGKDYKEIFNISYDLLYDKSFIDINIRPASVADAKERKSLLIESAEKTKLIEIDSSTRQFVIQKKYEDSDLASCIPLFQFIVRENKLYLFVHARSQNFYSNWLYDNQTYMLMMEEVLNNLNDEITAGDIFVTIASLHSYK